MNLIQKIEEIVHRGYQHADTNNLSEEGAVECSNVPLKKRGKILIYKFDKEVDSVSELLPFFTDVAHVKSMCDYILFYENNQKAYVILCNLKSNNLSNSHTQVHASHVFAQYLVGTANRLLNIHEDTNATYLAIHFRTRGPVDKFSPKKPTSSFREYNNGLKYLFLRCGQPFQVDTWCHF